MSRSRVNMIFQSSFIIQCCNLEKKYLKFTVKVTETRKCAKIH